MSKGIQKPNLELRPQHISSLYEKLILQLRDGNIIDRKAAEDLQTTLSALLIKIYTLDHEKGQLEKKLAFSRLHAKHEKVILFKKNCREWLKRIIFW